MKKALPLLVGGIALVAAAGAQAAAGFVPREANINAGPGANYPLVTSVPHGAPVQIYGCVEAYRWCDVMWKDQRGWVAGTSLQYENAGRRVGLYDGSVTVDVPIITYDAPHYWDEYYRERPFYHDRDRYVIVRP